MGEFGLITELLAPLADNVAAAKLTDDAAKVSVPDGQELVISTDMLVAGVHFPETASPELVAHRLVACNISDLAAKGAAPYGCLLTLGICSDWDDAFLTRFVACFGQLLAQYDLQLWGGDTVAAAQGFAGLSVHGLVPHGQMLTRNGARDGDDVYVTGTIGDGFLGLQHCLSGTQGDTLSAYATPQPPMVFGLALRDLANAALDVSDGLIADLRHICTASGGAMQIEAENVPLSDEGKAYAEITELLTAGDDLQIAFTASAENKDALIAAARDCGVQLSCIGRFSHMSGGAEDGVRLLASDGQEIHLPKAGFRHF